MKKNISNEICVAVIGAGRATELHMNAYKIIKDASVRFKWIISKSYERLLIAKEKYGFEFCSLDYYDALKDPDVDLIDICTPPYSHKEMILAAVKFNKHIICEKPLTGYFGNNQDEKPIGTKVTKKKMYESLLLDLDNLSKSLLASKSSFMYAENFIYAPAISKTVEIITSKKSKILYVKGEESLKGSSSPVAGEWCKTGGGTFIRTGSHPLSAILYLKREEAKSRGYDVYVKSVFADMSTITKDLTNYEHRHISAKPIDVEDIGIVVLTFSDGTKANIVATDTLLGGSKNEIDLYCNDVAIKCKLTLNDMMETYLLDEAGVEDVEFSEMLPSKIGWNKPFISDEIIRGYAAQMQDFVDCIVKKIEPKSNFYLAYDTIKIIYAAYLSAELGKKIVFKKNASRKNNDSLTMGYDACLD